MSKQPGIRVKCSKCACVLEECACCDEPDCEAAICYRCLNLALGQQVPQPAPWS